MRVECRTDSTRFTFIRELVSRDISFIFACRFPHGSARVRVYPHGVLGFTTPVIAGRGCPGDPVNPSTRRSRSPFTLAFTS